MIGAALIAADVGEAELPVGVLAERADTAETVALRVERDGWSIYPCGEQHDVDAGMSAPPRSPAIGANTNARF